MFPGKFEKIHCKIQYTSIVFLFIILWLDLLNTGNRSEQKVDS